MRATTTTTTAFDALKGSLHINLIHNRRSLHRCSLPRKFYRQPAYKIYAAMSTNLRPTCEAVNGFRRGSLVVAKTWAL
jgi:hypothetical protein